MGFSVAKAMAHKKLTLICLQLSAKVANSGLGDPADLEWEGTSAGYRVTELQLARRISLCNLEMSHNSGRGPTWRFCEQASFPKVKAVIVNRLFSTFPSKCAFVCL